MEVVPPAANEPGVFILDRKDVKDATFLLTGDLLESDGPIPVSSLTARGIQAVLAPEFGPVFYGECVTHGVLPLALGDEVLEAVAAWVTEHPLMDLTID